MRCSMIEGKIEPCYSYTNGLISVKITLEYSIGKLVDMYAERWMVSEFDPLSAVCNNSCTALK